MAGTLTVADLSNWVRNFAQQIREQKDHLTALDSAIGDADHGTNMDRGMTAVLAKLDGGPPASPAALFKLVGMTLVSSVGGAAGPLFGTFFLRLGSSLGDATEIDPDSLASGLRAGMEGVVARGRAEPGDKTMYDALAPAVNALDGVLTDGRSLGEGMRSALEAAEAGRDATIPMLARKGRASYLGERSVGHQDPGATTVALLVGAAEQTLG
ncbi:MAG: dihydroxyacetone kinase subunit DhaL [Micromonosporaceae bacterium]